MSELVVTTRESLVWAVATSIALTEGKLYAGLIRGDRQYTINLLKEVQAAIPKD